MVGSSTWLTLLEQAPERGLVARVLRPVVGVGVHAHARGAQRRAADGIRPQPGRLQRACRLALVRPLGAAGSAREHERQRGQRGGTRELRGHRRYGRRSPGGHQYGVGDRSSGAHLTSVWYCVLSMSVKLTNRVASRIALMNTTVWNSLS